METTYTLDAPNALDVDKFNLEITIANRISEFIEKYPHLNGVKVNIEVIKEDTMCGPIWGYDVEVKTFPDDK